MVSQNNPFAHTPAGHRYHSGHILSDKEEHHLHKRSPCLKNNFTSGHSDSSLPNTIGCKTGIRGHPQNSRVLQGELETQKRVGLRF